MWKRVFKWERGVLLMALLAIAVATNPVEQHFVKFVQEYTQRGLGFLPGALLAKPTGPMKYIRLSDSTGHARKAQDMR